MRKLIFLLLLLFYSFMLKAQTKGVVVDGTKNSPLSGVNVYLQRDSIGVGITDDEGAFFIPHNRVNAADTLVFSYVGYLPFRCTLEMLQRMNNRVSMFEQLQSLQEVLVSGERGPHFLEHKELAMLPVKIGLYSFRGFVHDRKIYIVAGDETVIELGSRKIHVGEEQGIKTWEFRSPKMYVYDIANDTWETSSVKVVPRAGHAALYYKDKIFILGGVRYSASHQIEFTDATMEVYDMKKDTLYVDPVNPHQAVDFTSFIYNDHLYVMGGAVKEREFTNKIHSLDLKNGVWYEMADTIPSEHCGRKNGILVGHRVYFFGGSRSTPQWTSVCYDLETGKWERLCDLKDGVAYPGLASHGDYIYIFENRYLQVYDIKSDSIRIYSLTFDFEDAGLFYADGNLYIVGGCIREGVLVTPSCEVFAVDVSRIGR
ncbi:Kelch repeat-containing protein [Bacteroides rodentium]